MSPRAIPSICGPKFMEEVSLANNQGCNPLNWDLDAMEQLQNIIIQGKQQLQSLFKGGGASGRSLNKERFMSGLDQLGRGMKKQLTQAQKDAIFNYLRKGQEEFTFEWFMFNFTIINHDLWRRNSQSDFGDGVPPHPATPLASGPREFPS